MNGQARPKTGGQHSVAAVVLVLVVAVSGCLAASGPSPETASEPNETAETATSQTATEPPAALDSQLAGLVIADNRTAYAEANGLDYEPNRTVGTATTTGQSDADGRVRAVVVLEANATLPEGYALEVVASADELVEVRVAVDDLEALARADGVRFVRPPRTPVSAGTKAVVSP